MIKRKIIYVITFIFVFIGIYCGLYIPMNKDECKAKQNICDDNNCEETNIFNTQMTTQRTTNAKILSTAVTTLSFSKIETTAESGLFTSEIVTTMSIETTTTQISEPPEMIQEETQMDDNDVQTEITTVTEDEIKDAIIINGNVMDIFYGVASQENVDEHDIVQDTGYFTDYSSTFLFGHNYGSFSCLESVNIGDLIILVNNGVEKKYVVTRSEKAIVSNNGFDIQSCSDGMRMVYNDFEYENIRLFTCLEESPDTYRWVVIGQSIE